MEIEIGKFTLESLQWYKKNSINNLEKLRPISTVVEYHGMSAVRLFFSGLISRVACTQVWAAVEV